MSWLDSLYAPRPPLAGTPRMWFPTLMADYANCTLTLAIAGGVRATSPAQSFVIGYQAALRQLHPHAPLSLGALCISERGSIRPSELTTRIHQGQLNGQKDFVTLVNDIDWLLIAARSETEAEQPHIQLLQVERGTPGLYLEPIEVPGLAPEIGAGRAQLQNCTGQPLDGDGWTDYLKPFRTLEDCLVSCAMLAWLHPRIRNHAELGETILSLLACGAEILRHPPLASTTHLLLAGFEAGFANLNTALDAQLQANDPDSWQLWQRDKGILKLSDRSRAQRLLRARSAST